MRVKRCKSRIFFSVFGLLLKSYYHNHILPSCSIISENGKSRIYDGEVAVNIYTAGNTVFMLS